MNVILWTGFLNCIFDISLCARQSFQIEIQNFEYLSSFQEIMYDSNKLFNSIFISIKTSKVYYIIIIFLKVVVKINLTFIKLILNSWYMIFNFHLSSNFKFTSTNAYAIFIQLINYLKFPPFNSINIFLRLTKQAISSNS